MTWQGLARSKPGGSTFYFKGESVELVAMDVEQGRAQGIEVEGCGVRTKIIVDANGIFPDVTYIEDRGGHVPCRQSDWSFGA